MRANPARRELDLGTDELMSAVARPELGADLEFGAPIAAALLVELELGSAPDLAAEPELAARILRGPPANPGPSHRPRRARPRRRPADDADPPTTPIDAAAELARSRLTAHSALLALAVEAPSPEFERARS